jgi:hypothetical protein
MQSRISVGVAIGVDSVAASWRTPEGMTEWSTSIAHDGHGSLSAEILRSAFADLRVRLPFHARATLAIAILPPLARVRRVELPRMRDEDRRLAISRVAERHFVGLPTPVVCAIERQTREGSVVPFLVAAASSALIQDLEQAAAECGWIIDRFVPGQIVWMTTGMRRWRELRRGDGRLVVADTHETTVLMIRGGALSVARRSRPGAGLSPDGAMASRSFILGDGTRSATLIAAGAASVTRSLQLVSDAARQARREAHLRVIRWLLCATAACVVAAGGVYRWGLSRHLSAIAIHRQAIRPRVTSAVAARDTLDLLLRSINAMRSLERATPRWSSAIARIVVALPQDVSLITLRADGDSVTLDGQAIDAASVFAALRSTPGVVDIRATAPIRQELAVGESSIERWTIALRVARIVAGQGDK